MFIHLFLLRTLCPLFFASYYLILSPYTPQWYVVMVSYMICLTILNFISIFHYVSVLPLSLITSHLSHAIHSVSLWCPIPRGCFHVLMFFFCVHSSWTTIMNHFMGVCDGLSFALFHILLSNLFEICNPYLLSGLCVIFYFILNSGGKHLINILGIPFKFGKIVLHTMFCTNVLVWTLTFGRFIFAHNVIGLPLTIGWYIFSRNVLGWPLNFLWFFLHSMCCSNVLYWHLTLVSCILHVICCTMCSADSLQLGDLFL